MRHHGAVTVAADSAALPLRPAVGFANQEVYTANVLRSVLLAGSQNRSLQKYATSHAFVRRAVSRFMPGETLDDALRVAAELKTSGITALVTELGENVSTPDEARAESARYVAALDRIAASGMDIEVSVKLTHLGLDFGLEPTLVNLRPIADRARSLKTRVWIDMESSAYTDRTLDVYRGIRKTHENVGLCLQSYLRRTMADLESLIPLGPAIRVVKGAYQEPAEIAFADKRETDDCFFKMCERLLAPDARSARAWLAVGTHDLRLIARVNEFAGAQQVPRDAYEFTLLYGIQRDEQVRLAREGYRSRVLISFGSHWFPWYMRRLAERPANVLFVVKSMFGG